MLILLLTLGCKGTVTDTAQDDTVVNGADSSGSIEDPELDITALEGVYWANSLTARLFEFRGDGAGVFGAGYSLAWDEDTRTWITGGPGSHDWAGSYIGFQPDGLPEDAQLSTSDASLYVVGPDGGYTGLWTVAHSGVLYGASEGYTGSLSQQGITNVFPLSGAPTDASSAVSASVTHLVGNGEEHWADLRWSDDQHTVITTSAGSSGDGGVLYVCDTADVTGGTWNTDTPLADSGCMAISSSYGSEGWPHYRVLRVGDSWVSANPNAQSAAGVIEVFDASGQVVAESIGDGTSFTHGHHIELVNDHDGDGVPDILAFDGGADQAWVLSSADLSAIHGPIDGEAQRAGSSYGYEWGISASLIEIEEEGLTVTLLAIGAMFAIDGNDRTGAVYLYEWDSFERGDPPLATIFGVLNDQLGRSVQWYTDPSATGWAQYRLLMGGDNGNVVFDISLQALADTQGGNGGEAQRVNQPAPDIVPERIFQPQPRQISN